MVGATIASYRIDWNMVYPLGLQVVDEGFGRGTLPDRKFQQFLLNSCRARAFLINGL